MTVVSSWDTAPGWVRTVIAVDPVSKIWFTHLPDCPDLAAAKHRQDSTKGGEVGQFACPTCIDVSPVAAQSLRTATPTPAAPRPQPAGDVLSAEALAALEAEFGDPAEPEPAAGPGSLQLDLGEHTPPPEPTPAPAPPVSGPDFSEVATQLRNVVTATATDNERMQVWAVTESWLRQLKGRLDDDAVSPGLAAVAESWALRWDGDGLDFMDKTRERCSRGDQLSRAQARGVLNCWRAQLYQGASWVH